MMEKQLEGAIVEKEEILDLLTDFATAIEAAALQLKQAVGKIVKVQMEISEEPFLGLKWEKKEGSRLKEYELTSKVANDGNDAFHHCLNVLRGNRATINNRFHCEGWKYGYWLYANKPGVIYRQPLKPKR